MYRPSHVRNIKHTHKQAGTRTDAYLDIFLCAKLLNLFKGVFEGELWVKAVGPVLQHLQQLLQVLTLMAFTLELEVSEDLIQCKHAPRSCQPGTPEDKDETPYTPLIRK